MNLDCYNHYPAPIEYEPNSMRKALKLVLKHLREKDLILPEAHLHKIQEIEFNLVDDSTIIELHRDYMDDPTPTDVITFHHGEVFVSYDTALQESAERKILLAQELYRYHVHGLLHLAGYDDLTTIDHTTMHKLQEELILKFYGR